MIAELTSLFFGYQHGSDSREPEDVCVLQFVLFPPHQCTLLRDGSQDESVESDAIRDKKDEFQFATEIWVEPQSGIVGGTNDGFRYAEGMKYNELPQKVCIFLIHLIDFFQDLGLHLHSSEFHWVLERISKN